MTADPARTIRIPLESGAVLELEPDAAAADAAAADAAGFAILADALTNVASALALELAVRTATGDVAERVRLEGDAERDVRYHLDELAAIPPADPSNRRRGRRGRSVRRDRLRARIAADMTGRGPAAVVAADLRELAEEYYEGTEARDTLERAADLLEELENE